MSSSWFGTLLGRRTDRRIDPDVPEVSDIDPSTPATEAAESVIGAPSPEETAPEPQDVGNSCEGTMDLGMNGAGPEIAAAETARHMLRPSDVRPDVWRGLKRAIWRTDWAPDSTAKEKSALWAARKDDYAARARVLCEAMKAEGVGVRLHRTPQSPDGKTGTEAEASVPS